MSYGSKGSPKFYVLPEALQYYETLRAQSSIRHHPDTQEAGVEGTMKVMISWSGEPSHVLAIALRSWLPQVIEGVQPFVSSEDIPKGSRWFAELSKQLETTSYGILCLTRDNQYEQWINFEAGAVSKQVDDSRISTFLIDLPPTDIKGPLAHFQATSPNKEDVFRLVRSIARAAGASLPDSDLRSKFEILWPWLESELSSLSVATGSGDDNVVISKSIDTVPASDDSGMTRAIIDDRLRALLILIGKLGGSRLALSELEPASGLPRVRFLHALDSLGDLGLIDRFNALPEGSALSLTAKGRRLLVEHGLA
jgi:hypothetical protein